MIPLHKSLPALSALRAFEAAARYQHFTKAADELCLTPSAVSRHVRTLEVDLGAKLFEREHRAVRLTADGRRLLEAVTMGLTHIGATAQDIRQRRNTGKLTVGMLTVFASALMVRRIGEFRRHHPEFDVHIVSLDRNPNPVEDDFDVSIVVGHQSSQEFESHLLFTEKAYPICSAGYLAQRSSLEQPADLLNEKLLHLDDACWAGFPSVAPVNWVSWLSQFGVELPFPPHGLIFSSYQMVIQAAIQGHGVAIGWHHFVADLIREGSLVRPIPQSCQWDDRGHYLVVSTSLAERPDVKAFCEWLKSEMKRTISDVENQVEA